MMGDAATLEVQVSVAVMYEWDQAAMPVRGTRDRRHRMY